VMTLREVIIVYLPWLMSACTIIAYWSIGNRTWWCWYLALFTQILWFIWIPLSETWGLLPTAFFLSVIHIRNIIKWRREAVSQ
jgi:hypothetical protein